jgi:tetratricopeptide (TPR) repeat protein
LEGLPKKFAAYQLHIYAGLIIICLILAGMTWQRNSLWRDPIALWQDNIVQSPSKKRGFVILGKHLLQANRPSEALEVLKNSGEVRQNLNGTVTTTYTTEAVLNMVVAYKKLKDYQTALKFIDQALVNPTILPFDKAKFYTNRGNIFYEQNQFQEAETSYLEAIKLYPQGLTARANLASIFAVTGRLQESEKLYTEMLAIDPNNQDIRNNLAQVRVKLAEPH